MSGKKYQDLVVTIQDPGIVRPFFEGKAEPVVEWDARCYEKTKIWMHTCIVHAPGAGMGAGDYWERNLPDGSVEKHVASRHRHDSDEIFIFHGTDPEHPFELGGEVKFWLGRGEDEEMFVIDKPTVVYIPGGVWHNPNFYTRADRPFLEIVIMVSGEHSNWDEKRYLDKTLEYPEDFERDYGKYVTPFRRGGLGPFTDKLGRDQSDL